MLVALVHSGYGSALAQSPGEYFSLRDLYIDAPEKAVSALANWPDRAIERSVEACVPSGRAAHVAAACSPQQRITAAMLHSEIAASTVGLQLARATFHVRMARLLLAGVDHAGFLRRWYEFVARVFLFEGYLAEAADLAEDGLRRFQDSEELYLTRGTTHELRVTTGFRDVRGHAQSREPTPIAAIQGLQAAMVDYRRALRVRPTFAAARVRLAWALMLSRDTRAGDELATALRDATDRDTRYVAHLLLGAIAEHAGRLDAALAAYSAARDQDPAAQTACVAAGRAEEALGHIDRSRAIGLACLLLPKNNDPWWSHAFGAFDTATLNWLRREARR